MKMYDIILKTITIISLILSAVSCQKNPTLTIHGKIPAIAGKVVYIDSITSSNPVCTDSAVVKEDGSFEIKRNAVSRMTFFQLRSDSLFAMFCADSTENIKFHASSHGELSITGDDEAAQVCKLSQHVRATNKYISTLMLMGDKCPKKQMKKLIYSRVMQYRTIADSLVKANPVAPVAYYAMNVKLIYGIEPYDFNDKDDRRLLAIVTNGWNMIRPNNVYSNQLLTKLTEKDTNSKVGDGLLYSEKASYVDLCLPDANEDIVSLNCIRNKNLILLFWNLRNMDPVVLENLKSYYKETPDLEIYHVSFDEDKEAFKEAAEQCPWICVNDLQGKSVVTYNLDVIPSVFLFNKNGTIVGKNIPFIGYKF
ncbi:MAG: DUF4369 domain-containing protein [Bacteroidales bacterium]|nr:DUF4369 domain-containing protein [Candidatus Scybalocola fimicaballi]